MEYTYDYYKKSADFILSKIDTKPQIAIVLGSYLNIIEDTIENKVVIEYKDIPNFLLSTVKSHAGKLIFGEIAGKNICCMSGRFHSYEGYNFNELAIPIRVLKLLGIKTVILTNAAGAINTEYQVGDIMIISDHIKLNESSPMKGKNIDEFGNRFFDVTQMYTPHLQDLALHCAYDVYTQSHVHKGVYFFASGPQFETPAEIRAMRILGGDAVGMSTVTESLTAAHCGMEVLGLSLITNMAAGILPQKISDHEIGDVTKHSQDKLKKMVTNIIKEME